MRSFKKIYSISVVLTLMASFILTGCSTPKPTQSMGASVNGYKGAPAKYVFYFIGDGMGLTQINSAEIFLGSTSTKASSEPIKLNFSQFSAQGMSTTYAADSFIPDSASAGTALASGYKTNDGVVNMDPAKQIKYKSIAEMAKEKGLKVGVVSSVSIDHATPAVFYAHQPSRNNYYEIGIELANSNFDYFGGGGFLSPKGKDGKQPDVLEVAQTNGYKIANTQESIEKLNAQSGKVIAISPVLDSSKALTFEVNRKGDLSLADFTRKGIEVLDNEKGFFMMVEGGKIDWAGHANDAAANIKDTLALQDAVGEAIKFYDKHPKDTAIIVTADHETGGMTIGFSGTKYQTFFDKVSSQKISYDEFTLKVADYKKNHTPETAKLEDLLPLVQSDFGLTVLDPKAKGELEAKAKAGDKDAVKALGMVLDDSDINSLKQALVLSMKDAKERPTDQQTYLLYGGYDPFTMILNHIINNKAGIGWTTYSHTGVPVPVYAKGSGEDLFEGYYDDTELPKKIMSILGISPTKE
ncbi:MAG: alkaline phosphatase [Desulfosporosinus sp. BRH_c37]|nr:MAG: alkaline phosphatase [Desulfosporosinus sp. BRH_c37]